MMSHFGVRCYAFLRSQSVSDTNSCVGNEERLFSSLDLVFLRSALMGVGYINSRRCDVRVFRCLFRTLCMHAIFEM